MAHGPDPAHQGSGSRLQLPPQCSTWCHALPTRTGAACVRLPLVPTSPGPSQLTAFARAVSDAAAARCCSLAPG